ncbi:hypothetical protein CI238_04647 [Colletotrichum incanum]|uniref:Uncharacterized protein n=1 Tax=Colletotrichum incanum TaxID=1573173 RepID=A0A161W1J7_COLIC|nr:hypothetical protein CI238_04647 [Colletotrichum incanum]
MPVQRPAQENKKRDGGKETVSGTHRSSSSQIPESRTPGSSHVLPMFLIDFLPPFNCRKKKKIRTPPPDGFQKRDTLPLRSRVILSRWTRTLLHEQKREGGGCPPFSHVALQRQGMENKA